MKLSGLCRFTGIHRSLQTAGQGHPPAGTPSAQGLNSPGGHMRCDLSLVPEEAALWLSSVPCPALGAPAGLQGPRKQLHWNPQADRGQRGQPARVNAQDPKPSCLYWRSKVSPRPHYLLESPGTEKHFGYTDPGCGESCRTEDQLPLTNTRVFLCLFFGSGVGTQGSTTQQYLQPHRHGFVFVPFLIWG